MFHIPYAIFHMKYGIWNMKHDPILLLYEVKLWMD
jgi:hypothetical protein